LNRIDVIISAIDPDEDYVYYSSESNVPEFSLPDLTPLSVFIINGSFIGYHNITIIATDQEESDKQVLRLLVDRIIEPNATLSNPYGNSFYSREDPFFLNATKSKNSLDQYADYLFTWFDYDPNINPNGTFLIETEHYCVAVQTGEECSEAQIDIETITDYTNVPEDFLILKVDLFYTELSQKELTEFNLIEKECIPYRADSDPYPYHTTENPFMANHSCCLGNINNPETWQLASTNVVCHEEPTCFGVTTGLKKRLRQIHCSGERGNICNGHVGYADSDICGCNEAAAECDNVKAYRLKNGQGWCYGNEGCKKFCDSAVVDNGNGIVDSGDSCGCLGKSGDKCDENFDGSFDGECTLIGSCTEVLL
jgi:hypothetical protein